MKKALPIITLVCYLVAVAGCIAHIICKVIPSTGSLILFIAYVVGVLALMGLSTAITVKTLRELFKIKEAVEAASISAEEDANNESNLEPDETTASEDAVEDESMNEETPAADEAAEESEPVEAAEAVEAVEAVEEVEAVETVEEVEAVENVEAIEAVEDEIADDAAPEEETLEEEEDLEEDDEDSDDDGDDDDSDDDDDCDTDTAAAVAAGADLAVSGVSFKEARLKRSYTSKLIQSPDETKDYYSTIKNAFLSYKKITSTVSQEHERFRRGRTTVGIIKLRGKTVLLYLALDPAQFENTMYVGKDVSATVKYADVPFLYRVNGPRKAARAVKLIDMVAGNHGLESTPERANEDYKKHLPYESTEELIKKGLIVDKVEEANRKAEEARIAAEAAEKAAEQAINDAIKLKESAEQAASKAAEKAETHGEAPSDTNA